jgi:DAHP synthase ferredoxin-like domain
MLIVMKPNATASEIDAVVHVVEAVGFRAHPMPGATRTAIGITGNEGPVDGRRFENLAGVAEVIRVTKPYKLITLDLRPDKTVVRVGDGTVGDSELESRTGVRDREDSAAKWCAFLSWLCLETSNVALHVPGRRRKRLGNYGSYSRGVRLEDCD